MRFAVWTAVSTDAQAKADKVSLSEQLARCRDAGTSRGWVESAGPFSAPGESRTKYVNLSDAERAIPALAGMLDAAKAGLFDVLVLYDFNRLRDLLQPVEKTLAAYRVQMFSVSQPVEPSPPGKFEPYGSDTSNIMTGMAQILSKAQIADLRRKYNYAMPRRAQRGLPVNVPYGYRRIDRKTPPVLVPEQADQVLRMKDLLFSGLSTSSIAVALNEDGIPSPGGARWSQQTVRGVLINPFYGGEVQWGKSQVEHDPRTGKTRRERKPPLSRIITAQGQHEPLWDSATHQRIVDILRARGKSYEAKRANQLTGLLYCGDCDARMWVYYRYPQQTINEITWYCSAARNGATGHPRVKHPDAVRMVGAELQVAVMDAPLEIPEKVRGHSELHELQARRGRVSEAYEAGVMPLGDYAERIAELDAAIKREVAAESDVTAQKYEAGQRREALQSLKENAAHIPDWIEQAAPREVNHVLRILLAKIILHEDRAELVFRS